MPQNPGDMIDDLVKMGLYKPESFKIADSIHQAELRKALFLKMTEQGKIRFYFTPLCSPNT